jgi:alpha-tubulin suppressor-like RCC1 family protein
MGVVAVASTGWGAPKIVLERAGVVVPALTTVKAWGVNWSDQTAVPADLTGVTAVAAGWEHSLALKSDGTVIGWGKAADGRIRPPSGLTGVTAIAAGDEHSLALKSDGSVVGWGYGGWNQLPAAGAWTGMLGISAGEGYSLALTSTNTAVGVGLNGSGQRTIPGTATNLAAISAGASHVVALTRTGTVVTWGSTAFGKRTVPLGLANVIAVGAGQEHSVALQANGTVVAWGDDSYDQRTVPVAALSGVVAISVGKNHNVALKVDGTIVGWGDPAAAPPAGITDVQSIAAGGDHSLAIIRGTPMLDLGNQGFGSTGAPVAFTFRNTGNTSLTLGAISLEGANPGDFGVTAPLSATVAAAGTTTFTIAFTPGAVGSRAARVRVVTNDPAANPYRIDLKGAGTCPIVINPIVSSGAMGVTYSQSFYQTGGSGVPTFALASGVLPLGLTLAPNGRLSGIPSQGGSFPITVRVTDGQGCVGTGTVFSLTIGTQPHFSLERPVGQTIITPRTPVGWGANNLMQTTIPPGLGDVQSLAAGAVFSLGLRSDGTVAAWGSNLYGERVVPNGLSGVVAIAAGCYHAVALKSNGSVTVWGDGFYGQRTVPPSAVDLVAIAAGGRHSLGVRNNGAVVAWGNNAYAQITVPSGLESGVRSVAAGLTHSVALRTDGTVVAWGRDNFGQTAVPEWLSGVQAIAAGGEHTLALLDTGGVVAWGSDIYGQSTVPNTLSGVIAIAAGDSHSMALKSNGSIVSWGLETDRYLATPLAAAGAMSLVAGGTHALALVRGVPVVDLGRQDAGVSSPPTTFTIKNTGGAPLTLGAVTKDGVHPGEFSLSAFSSSTVAAGASASFSIVYTPTGTGLREAVIHIPTNDPTASVYHLKLTGSGPTPIELWRQQNFGSSSNTGAGADLADPNANGIVNLIEYALGGNPMGNPSGLARQPVISLTPAQFLRLTFDRTVARTDVTLVVQVTEALDGLNWYDLAESANGAPFAIVSGSGTATATETGAGATRTVTITDEYPVSDPTYPSRLMRLKVVRP